MITVGNINNLEAKLKSAIEVYNKDENKENYEAAQILLNRYLEAKQGTLLTHLEEKNELIKQFIAERQSHNQSAGGAVNGSQPAPKAGEKAIGGPSAVKGSDSDDEISVGSNNVTGGSASAKGKVEVVSEKDTPKSKSYLNIASSMLSFIGLGNKANNPNPAANAENAEEGLLSTRNSLTAQANSSAIDEQTLKNMNNVIRTIENNAKATKIQAVARGKIARNQAKQEKAAAITIQKVYRGDKGKKAFRKVVNQAMANKDQLLKGMSALYAGSSLEDTPDINERLQSGEGVQRQVEHKNIIDSRAVRYAKLTKRNELLKALYGRDWTTLFSETLKPYDNSYNSASNIRKDVYNLVRGKINGAIIDGNENVEISLARLESMGREIDKKHVVNIKERVEGEVKIVKGIRIPVMYMDRVRNQLKPLDIDVEVKYNATTQKKRYERKKNQWKILGMPMGDYLTGKRGHKLGNWLGYKIDPGVSSKSLDSMFMYNPNNDQMKATTQNIVAIAIGMVAAFWLILSANQVATGAALIGTLAIPGGPAIVLAAMAVIIAGIVGIYVYNHWDSVKQGSLMFGAGLLYLAMRAFELVIAKPLYAIGLIALSTSRFAANLIGNASKAAVGIAVAVLSLVYFGSSGIYGLWYKNSEIKDARIVDLDARIVDLDARSEDLLAKVAELTLEIYQIQLELYESKSNPNATITEEQAQAKIEELRKMIGLKKAEIESRKAEIESRKANGDVDLNKYEKDTTLYKVTQQFNDFKGFLKFQLGLIFESGKSFGNSILDVLNKLNDVIARKFRLDTSEVRNGKQATAAATAPGQGENMVATTSTDVSNYEAFELLENNASSQKQDKHEIQKKLDQTNESCKDIISKGQDVLFRGNVSSSILSLFPKADKGEKGELGLPLLEDGHRTSNNGV